MSYGEKKSLQRYIKMVSYVVVQRKRKERVTFTYNLYIRKEETLFLPSSTFARIHRHEKETETHREKVMGGGGDGRTDRRTERERDRERQRERGVIMTHVIGI